MSVEFKIDWLQFSARVEPVLLTQEENPKPEKSTMRFYRTMQKYSNGVVRHHGNPNTDKSLFVLSGKVCDRLCIDSQFCNHVIYDWRGNVGRIDLAMTTDIPILDKIMKFQSSVVSEMYPVPKAFVDQNMGIETIYFGDMKKRGKKGIVRCYDKAKQLDLSDCLLHRVEIENKGKNATIATKRIANNETIGSVMNAKWMINEDWYTDLVGEGVSTTRFKNELDDEMSDIERKIMWIHNQVIPSLQEIIDYDVDNGTENFNAIMDKLNYRRLYQ